jgi:hypothetical protein
MSVLGKYKYGAGWFLIPVWLVLSFQVIHKLKVSDHYKYIIGKVQILKLHESIILTFLKAAMRNQRIGR